MSGIAIVMMALFIIVIWGGLAVALGPLVGGSSLLAFGFGPGIEIANVTSRGGVEVGCRRRAPGTTVAMSQPAGTVGLVTAKRAIGAASAFARRM